MSSQRPAPLPPPLPAGDLSLNPWAGPDQSSLLAVGAQQAYLVTEGGQWWRLFSSPFVNAGVIQVRGAGWLPLPQQAKAVLPRAAWPAACEAAAQHGCSSEPSMAAAAS